MTETGWQAIGRVAKERRRRLGLKQDELALYRGPGVSTVGKFERAKADFSPKTHQQLEISLGWSRGVIEDFVTAYEEGDSHIKEWEHELIEDNIPDLTRPGFASVGEAEAPDEYAQAVGTLARVLRLVDPANLEAAVRAALVALLSFLSVDGATELGRGIRHDFSPEEGGDGNADSTELGGSAPTSAGEPRQASDGAEGIDGLSIEDEVRRADLGPSTKDYILRVLADDAKENEARRRGSA